MTDYRLELTRDEHGSYAIHGIDEMHTRQLLIDGLTYEMISALRDQIDAVLDFAAMPISAIVDRNDGWRFVKVGANVWVPMGGTYSPNDFNDDSMMQWQVDNGSSFTRIV